MFFRPDKLIVQVLLFLHCLYRQQKLLYKSVGLTCSFLEANISLNVNNAMLKEINCTHVSNRAQ